MSRSWTIVPDAPASGHWEVTLPASAPGASIGELKVWSKPLVTSPLYSGKFARIDQNGVSTSFTYLARTSFYGPANDITVMESRVLVRFIPATNVYLMGVDSATNLMFWLYTDSGSFVVKWVTNWSTGAVASHTVTIPAAITASTWFWLRANYYSSTTFLDYSLEHNNPNPTSWVNLGTWPTSSVIPIRPSGLGLGYPYTLGASGVSGGPSPTGPLDFRRIFYHFNSDPSVLSTFEVDPVRTFDSFSGTQYLTSDTPDAFQWTCHPDLPLTVETE